MQNSELQNVKEWWMICTSNSEPPLRKRPVHWKPSGVAKRAQRWIASTNQHATHIGHQGEPPACGGCWWGNTSEQWGEQWSTPSQAGASGCPPACLRQKGAFACLKSKHCRPPGASEREREREIVREREREKERSESVPRAPTATEPQTPTLERGHVNVNGVRWPQTAAKLVLKV